jgi:hypothetical protein
MTGIGELGTTLAVTSVVPRWTDGHEFISWYRSEVRKEL